MKLRLLVMASAVAACSAERQSDATTRDARPDSAAVDSSMAIVARTASVAIAMDAPNADADSILTGAGLTVAEYEALMYRVAADTALTRLFEEAIAKR